MTDNRNNILLSDIPSSKKDQVAELREKIADIVKLAHSSKPDDEAKYRDRQVELRDLAAQLIKAESDQADEPVDLTNAVVEKMNGMWRIVAGTNRLAWSFGDRQTAEKFLEQLKRDEQLKDLTQ